jgi:hypothetical protein
VKRRITLVVDDDRRVRLGLEPVDLTVLDRLGVTVEADDVIPEPDHVQEFNVRIVTKADYCPFSAGEVNSLIQRTQRDGLRGVAVTEVPATEVER